MSGTAVAFPKAPGELRASITRALSLVPTHLPREPISTCTDEFLQAVRELGCPILVQDAIPPDHLSVLLWRPGHGWSIGMHLSYVAWIERDGTPIHNVTAWFPLPADLYQTARAL